MTKTTKTKTTITETTKTKICFFNFFIIVVVFVMVILFMVIFVMIVFVMVVFVMVVFVMVVFVVVVFVLVVFFLVVLYKMLGIWFDQKSVFPTLIKCVSDPPSNKKMHHHLNKRLSQFCNSRKITFNQESLFHTEWQALQLIDSLNWPSGLMSEEKLWEYIRIECGNLLIHNKEAHLNKTKYLVFEWQKEPLQWW